MVDIYSLELIGQLELITKINTNDDHSLILILGHKKKKKKSNVQR